MLQVGEFSKICAVSVKTLHHYDRIGLLRPESVDPVTGYRYYSTEQIDRMLYIQRLKRYGFSLEEVQELLSCTDSRALYTRLLQQKEKLQQEQRDRGTILQELRSHLLMFERTGDIMTYQKGYTIAVKDSPELPVMACRQRMGVDDFGKYYGAIFERMTKAQAAPAGLTGAMYYDREFDPNDSDIELFVAVREANKADRTLAARPCAVTVHRGAYSTLPEAYGALVSWIEANGYVCDGAPYELYLKTQFDGLDPADWETEIYFPIRKK